MQVFVAGNSVARMEKFGVTRGLIAALTRATEQHKTVWRYNYSSVHGGFGEDQVWRCGMSQIAEAADLVVFHYDEVRTRWELHETILRAILAMPRRPLLLYIQHCTVLDVPESRADFYMAKRHRNGSRVHMPSKFKYDERHATLRREELQLALHYNLTMISTCNLFEAVLKEPRTRDLCADASESFSSFGDLYNSLFQLGQPHHQSKAGVELQACAAADVLLGDILAGRPAAPATLPSSLYAGRSGKGETEGAAFCLSPDDLRPQLSGGSGWSYGKGGSGGRKQWLNSSAVGARLDLRMPYESNFLYVTVYMHHGLPLGRLSIEVEDSGLPATVIDACCPSSGCLVTQGKRKMPLDPQLGSPTEFRVPSQGTLPLARHTLRITNVARARGERSLCSQPGAEVFINMVVGSPPNFQ